MRRPEAICEEIEFFLDRTREADAPLGALLAERLAELADAMEGHQMRLRTSGAVRELDIQAPQLSRPYEHLKRRHNDVVRRLRFLAERLSEHEAGQATPETLGDVRDTIGDLARHEDDETRLLMNAYWQDTGAAD